MRSKFQNFIEFLKKFDLFELNFYEIRFKDNLYSNKAGKVYTYFFIIGILAASIYSVFSNFNE